MANIYTKVQQVANQNAVAGTSLSVATAATQFGNLLIAIVAVAANTAGIAAPAGWLPVTNNINTNPVGGTGRMFYYPNNPGGITSVQFTFASGLASAIIYEFSGYSIVNNPTPLDVSGGFANTNGTGWGLAGQSIQELNELAIGACIYVNNTALTSGNLPPGFVEDSNAISTNAAGNAGIRVILNINVGNSNMPFGGMTISGTPTNGPTTLLGTFLFSATYKNNGNVGPANLEGALYS